MATKPRESINGHHPDCPYGRRARPVEHCNVCQGIRKGADPDYQWAPTKPAKEAPTEGNPKCTH